LFKLGGGKEKKKSVGWWIVCQKGVKRKKYRMELSKRSQQKNESPGYL